MALLADEAGAAIIDVPCKFRSIVGSEFTASVAQFMLPEGAAARGCVRVSVSGRAFHTAVCEFVLAPEDALGAGFVVR